MTFGASTTRSKDLPRRYRICERRESVVRRSNPVGRQRARRVLVRRAKFSLACAVVVSVLFAMDTAPKGLHGRSTALAQVPAARTPAADFVVSPQGNDRWSGRLADPGENDGPFATVARAHQAVRALLPTLNPRRHRARGAARWHLLSRRDAHVWARRFRCARRSRGVRGGAGRESGPQWRSSDHRLPHGRSQRPGSLDRGRSRRARRTVAFPATLCQRRPPSADEAAEARGIPHRISAGLHGRLSPESDEAVRLCPG